MAHHKSLTELVEEAELARLFATPGLESFLSFLDTLPPQRQPFDSREGALVVIYGNLIGIVVLAYMLYAYKPSAVKALVVALIECVTGLAACAVSSLLMWHLVGPPDDDDDRSFPLKAIARLMVCSPLLVLSGRPRSWLFVLVNVCALLCLWKQREVAWLSTRDRRSGCGYECTLNRAMADTAAYAAGAFPLAFAAAFACFALAAATRLFLRVFEGCFPVFG